MAAVAATFALGYVGGLVAAPREESEVRTIRVAPAAQAPSLTVAVALPEYQKPPEPKRKPLARKPERRRTTPVARRPSPAASPAAPPPAVAPPASPAPSATPVPPASTPMPTPAPPAAPAPQSFDDGGEPNAGEFDYEGGE